MAMYERERSIKLYRPEVSLAIAEYLHRTMKDSPGMSAFRNFFLHQDGTITVSWTEKVDVPLVESKGE